VTLLALMTLSQAGANPARAQLPDEGVFVVRQKGQEIGRESFKFRPARHGRAAGDSIILAASYPAVRPTAEFRAVLEQGPGTALALEINVVSPEGATQIYAAVSRSRVTVRTVARGIESAREFPGGDHIVLLDENLYGLFLTVARSASDSGTQMIAIYPRSGRTVSFTARRSSGQVNIADTPATEIRLMGDLNGSINLDNAGKLVRVALPDLGLEATRLR
jgi:hypothetical protein